jgi:soluble lytic murein transglycosylase-like protein
MVWMGTDPRAKNAAHNRRLSALRRCRPLWFVLLAATLAPAAEQAVLHTGFRVRVERHEADGDTTRLFLPGGGVVDVRSSDIRGFEQEEYTPPPPAPPSQEQEAAAGSGLEGIVRASGDRHGLDPDLIHSVIRAESAGNPRAVSAKGAGGLMQLMPGTARTLDVQDVFDPAQNVEAGTRYLRDLLERYKDDPNSLALALAAYNAGPEKVEAYKGIPPYRETREYVGRVIRDFNRTKIASEK